jgi:hypothetical protein
MHILQAAQQLRPGTAWVYSAGVLTQAEDGTPRVVPPTQAELDAVINAVAYRDQRAAAYPAITDQLDAIMKGGQALADMQAACMAVKAKYPKGA